MEQALTRKRYEAIVRDGMDGTPPAWGVWDWELNLWAIDGFGDIYKTRNRQDALDVALMANYWEGRS